jgi:hypothetical protein
LNPYIEMTVRIDADAHPLLYQYLSTRRQGKPRAAAFKRVAENSLLLSGQPELCASHVKRNADARPSELWVKQSPPAEPAFQPGVSQSDVNASLAQFLPSGRL